MNRAVASLLLVALTAGAQPLNLAPPAVKDTKEGEALRAELLAQRPAENSTVAAVLKSRDGGGHRVELPVKLATRIIDDTTWQATYETTPPDQQPVEKLTVVHRLHGPNEYLYARAGEPAAAPLGHDRLFTPFAGTDFHLADLGLEFLHWPQQALTRREMRRGRTCKVLESVNPSPAGGAYARVLSWIDNETGGLLRAEAYDAKDQLVKEFSIRSFKKVEGRWELKEMEVLNPQRDSRTRLEFNLAIP